MKQAEANMRRLLTEPFEVREWGGRALEAMSKTWTNRTVAWDWEEIMRRHRDPDTFAFTIWAEGDRLAGQGLALTTEAALNFRFFEGDPRGDCPLRGRRIAIALEACTLYAQLIGKPELRVSPTHSTLESLYRDRYGFRLVNSKADGAYYAREV